MSFDQAVREQEPRIVPLDSRKTSHKNQIVTLAFLSPELPSALLAEELAEYLRKESASEIALVRLVQENTHASLISNEECVLNGEFHMPGNMPRTESGFALLTLSVKGEQPSAAGIASLIEQLGCLFRYVLIEVHAHGSPAPWLLDFLNRSDLAYLFTGTGDDNARQLESVMREARAQCCGAIGRIKTIACLDDNEQATDFELLVQRRSAPIHLFVRGCPRGPALSRAMANGGLSKTFHADLRRLAREIGGSLVGLALSSGAAKGFAHIGVIQVLEENGIEIDVVAGSSMGAYVGSLWAHGNDGGQLENFAREMEKRWGVWSLIDPVFPPRQGFLRGLAIKKRLMQTIADCGFGNLKRPMRIVAANLATLERVVFAAGEVATAVHASLAVPGICVPIVIDGVPYVDGGIVDPLPVDVLREMGIRRVIAVDVIPTPDRIRLDLQDRRAPKGSGHSSEPQSEAEKLRYFTKLNFFEVLMRSVYGGQMRMAEASCRQADLVLRPDICDDRWLDFRHPAKFIALGRAAALRHLDEIKALVCAKNETHEREFASKSVASIA